MKLNFTLKLFILFFLFTIPAQFLSAQYIKVEPNYTAEKLVKDIFIGSSCIEVVHGSIKIQGWNFGDGDKSYGYFDKGTSSFPIENGILLSSGKLNDAPGPNNGINSADNSGWYGDNDLENALGISRTTNATILEFDFISSESNHISFDYLFASEQYLRQSDFGSCGYTDGFAFLIKKAGSTDSYKNLAVLPNTSTPVSVNTVYGNGGKCPPVNPQYFGQFNPTNSPIGFNGQTKVLTATTAIIPGEKYHLKIVIADQGNGLYDSGVFLKAGSFVGTKSLGNDLLTANGTGLCQGSTHVIDATTTNTQSYKWYKDGVEILGETNAKLTVNQAGYYEVEITQISGCKLNGNLTVEMQIDPVISQTIFNVCDNDLDGKIEESLSDFTDYIIEDFNYSSFSIKYFETKKEAEDNISIGIDKVSFLSTETSKSIFIRIQPGSCKEKIIEITFINNGLSQYNIITPIEICDTEIDGKVEVNLSDYINTLITNIDGLPTYYNNEDDAKKSVKSIDFTQTINSDKTFYIRFKQSGLCDNIAPISFKFKQPKRSTILKDVTICKNATTILDAGVGFDSYLWSNGATTSSIQNVAVGVYHVKLEYDGCFYTQEVNVIAAEDPIITSINIQGSTVTVLASGSTPPYLYALDNGSFQTSNIFTNVTLGNHIIHVKSNLGCASVSKEFSVIKLLNFISPNGDGKNDVLDYSQLKNKINPKFTIFDRFGKLIFEGSEANNFTWNGMQNGFVVETTSYWYVIEWTESGSDQLQRFSNWLLVKSK